MRKKLSLLFLVFEFVTLGYGATTITDPQYNLSYSINSDGNASISAYKGSNSTIIVPERIGNAQVTKVEMLISSANAQKAIQEIYFYTRGISLTGNIINSNENVETIVFSDGNISVSGSSAPFTLYHVANYRLDNIITLSPCALRCDQLFGSQFERSWKTETIDIRTSEGKTYSVQIFFVEQSKYTTKWSFYQSRYEYLLNALEKNGIRLNTITSIDFSKAGLYNPTFEAAYNPAEKLAPGATVKISDDLTYQNSSEYTLNDLVNYSGIDIEAEITYTRNDTKGWNSFCLPFDVAETNFNESVEIYEFAAGTESSLRLKRVANGQTTVAKGTPFFVKTQEESLTLKATATLSSTTTAQDITHDSWCLHGSFEEKPIRANTYKILEDGSAFGITNEGAKTYPYRCYLEYIGNQAAPERLSTIIDEETKIEVIHSGNSTEHVRLYDLMGRPRKDGQPGLFVR